MLLSCGVGKDCGDQVSWTARRSNQSILKEIKLVNPKENQSWIFTGRADAEAETPIFWPPDAKNWLIWKDPDAGKDWRWEEKRTTEDEMVRWHHQFNGREFEQVPRVGDGQGSLVCCSPWGYKESDTTEQLKWTDGNSMFKFWGIFILFSQQLHYWRRQWHPTPVFLPGESQGQGSLVGCRLWGRTESDTTEAT